ncbi:MAG: serine/threonine protein phosphatase [Ilumatobacteraceae bacterium]|nr:serine/threonine protein phosphatase [Ilumatobacteraceae bacterium]
MTTLRSGSATHVGQVRSNNQDSFLVLAEADLFGVADGMGGHNGGEVASAMAVEHLREHAGEPSLENLQQAARIGNRAIFEKAGAEADLHGMGTTLCAVRVVPGPEGDEIAWINVGDSRVYLFRDDSLIQLSRDHSLVEDLLRDGQLTEDEAKVHPKRNIITRALGIDVDVDVDGSTVIPFNGDRFLLCSDGLFGEVTGDQISSVLRRLAEPTEAAEELVRLANESGGRDNITVVLVEVVDDDGRSAAASAALAKDESTLASRQDPTVVGDDADTRPVGEAGEPGETGTAYVPVFADRKSSLPDAPDFASEGDESDDLFGGLDHQRSKRVTWRVVVFIVALLAVVGVVLGAIVWTGNNTYYVAFDGRNVAIYQGKPGGVLWIEPKLVQTTDITRSELPEDVRGAVAANKEFSSEGAATRYVVTLQAVVDKQADATSTTTSSTTTTRPVTTTTAAGAVTTTAPATPTTTAP